MGGAQEGRAERVARNEALFREVNERSKDLARVQERSDLPILCECGSSRCADGVTIDRSAYEAVRANNLRFIVKPGHELPEFERVVGRRGGYVIVEKFPEAEPQLRLGSDE